MKKIILALAAIAALTSQVWAGYWQMEGHLPQGAIDDMAVTGIQIAGNTMIAVIGGNNGGSAINGVYYYEINNKNWHDGAWGIPQYPHQVYGLAAASVGDTIYPNGGYFQDLMTFGDTTYYPIWMSGWYPVPGLVMQTPRMNHGLVAIDHDLYAVGGTVFGGAVDSTMEILRLNGGTVSGGTAMPQSRTEAVVVRALGSDGENHIYVIGGRTNSGAVLNSVIQYDTSFSGGSWSGKTSIPGPGRKMATGTVLNNKIYVMGGADLSGNVTRRVDIYDPTTDSWAPGDSLPLSIIRAGAYGVNNVIYFFGGFDKGMSAQTDSVWQYHPLAPNSPPLIRPLNNALINDQSPVFYWGEVDSAEGYRIQVSSDPTFMTVDIADYTSYSSTDTSFGGVSLTPAGDFFWRVKTYDWSVPDSSGWSPVRRLTLDMTPPSTPYPATPSDGSYTNNASVNFSWSSVADARWYRLQVDNTDASFTTLIINDSTITATGASIDMSPWGGNGHYTWRVEARDTAGNWSGYHSYPSFTLDQTAPLLMQTYPFNGNVGIDPNDDIILGFSEPIDPGTFSFNCSPDPDPLAWTYSWTATGDTVYIGHAVFPSGSTITATINVAQDLAGNNFALNSHANPWYFTTTVDDVTPPNIYNVSADIDPLSTGNNYVLTANIDDVVQMGSATLYWGQAGAAGYTTHPMSPNGTGKYEATISGTDIKPEGVRYQIEAVDSAGNYSYHPSVFGTPDFYIKEVYFNGFIPTAPVGYDQWQMISIPADARTTNIYGQLENDLGVYDNTKWRLFIWGGNYGEIAGFPSGTIYKLGQAYWLRHRTSKTFVSFEGPGHSYGNFNESKTCSLALEPGWTDVGTPFLFNIPWVNVQRPVGIYGPYHYNGSRWMDPSEVETSTSFESYKGYSYRNDSSSTYLEITPTAKKKSGKATACKQPNGWQAVAKVENQSGSDNNTFGLSSDASLQRDQYDYPEPPSGLTGTSGYFRLANDQFCTDIRPELGDGQTWDFAVDCQGQTKLTITLPVEFPAGTGCYLADLSRQVSVNIKDDQTYSFTPEPGEKVREFKIVAGQADYAKGVLGTSFALPSATLLAQNRPNPLRDNTSISYQLAADGPVKLAVYNVAGQLVKTIVNQPQMAGRYTVTWNGRDESGRQAATGVYFYRLTANGASASRTMNLIK